MSSMKYAMLRAIEDKQRRDGEDNRLNVNKRTVFNNDCQLMNFEQMMQQTTHPMRRKVQYKWNNKWRTSID